MNSKLIVFMFLIALIGCCYCGTDQEKMQEMMSKFKGMGGQGGGGKGFDMKGMQEMMTKFNSLKGMSEEQRKEAIMKMAQSDPKMKEMMDKMAPMIEAMKKMKGR